MYRVRKASLGLDTHMKKHGIGVAALLALIACCAALVVSLVGCSSSSSGSAHTVYKVQPVVKAAGSKGFDCYEVVYYNEGKKDKNTEGIELIEHNNDILTRLDDEYHLKKSDGWTEDDAKKVAAELYTGLGTSDFVTKSVTDKGDYYCVHVKYDNLTNLDNLQKMVDNGVLEMTDEGAGSKVSERFSAGSVMNSIVFSGGKKLSDDEASRLDLHYSE